MSSNTHDIQTTRHAAFGKWLKERRKAFDMTREKLALCAGCSPATIEKIESGLRRPSRDLAGLLLRCLSVPEERVDALVLFARGGPATDMTDTKPHSPVEQRNVHLPAQATDFIGREQEIIEIRDALRESEVRLLTLTGPPGIGKTRLSLEAAEPLGNDFQDGIFFVPLAPITDHRLVIRQIAGALGVHESSGQGLLEILGEHLHDRKVLIVLDNFEHLPEAAPDVAKLMSKAPGLKIVASSRSALRTYGEHVFHVPPMSFPRGDEAAALLEARQLDRLLDFEAVALFVQRARGAQHDFAVTPMNMKAIAEICRKLEGLPLAIELAAFRTNVLSPRLILDKLSHSLDLLANGPADLPHRQRNLRGAVAWSYGLLTPQARTLFNRFSVFAGGCNFIAIESLSNALPGDGDAPLVDTLSTLVDSSLLRRQSSGDEVRFSMLETVREYAAEQLAANRETEATGEAHARYYLNLAESAEPEIAGPGQTEWLDRLEREHDNLRAALRYFAARGAIADVARMCAALRRFWYFRGHLSEGLQWMRTVLEHKEEIPTDIAARVLQGTGTFYWIMGEGAEALKSYRESLAIYRALGDRQGIASVLNNLGITMTTLGDYGSPPPLYLESLQIFTDIGDEWSICVTLSNLGLSALNLGIYDEAEEYLTRSLNLRRALDDKQGEAQSLNNLGIVARCKGEYERSYALHALSLQMFHDLGDRWSAALTMANMGHLALDSERADDAAWLFKDSLSLHRELSSRPGITDCLEGLAQAAQSSGKVEIAAMLFGGAEKLREDLGMPVLPYNMAGYRTSREATGVTLGAEPFEEARQIGKAMTLEKLCLLAQRV